MDGEPDPLLLNPFRRWRVWRLIAAAALCAVAASSAYAQLNGRGVYGRKFATTEDSDGGFHYCRMVYFASSSGTGGGWTTDFPRADINMSIRLAELTRTNVSRNKAGQPNHLLVRIGGEELFQCPLTIMSAPGRARIDRTEAEQLRAYLLKGGILWTDDTWGTYQWNHWLVELRKVLPAADYPIFDLPLDHPLFRTQFEVPEVPQIPNITFFMRTGGRTSEQGADSAVPHASAITDAKGRLMVLMTHNTDIQDSWEREGDDPRYFYAFSPRGYAFGINAILYALTH